MVAELAEAVAMSDASIPALDKAIGRAKEYVVDTFEADMRGHGRWARCFDYIAVVMADITYM